MVSQHARNSSSVGTRVGGLRSATTSGARVSVVHVGHDEPSAIVTLAKRERELPRVGLAALSAETTDDVSDRALGRVGQRTQDQRTARAFVVLLDVRAPAHGGTPARE